MGLKLGICGVGAFADCFIPLFKLHPGVDEIVLGDLDAKKLQAKSAAFGLPKTCPSLEKLCESDVDAIAIFSQHWLHGPQAVQALRARKHVYSAVPSAITLDEIRTLVKTVEETGQIYMVGETSYYYPAAIYCRDQFQKGAFGHIVYGEAEYYHDFDHGLYAVLQERGGKDWKKIAGTPPMYYPTHTTSLIISVTGSHMTRVSCQGWVDKHEDGLFQKGVNQWDNAFSNETALFRMSDGSSARINEFRRIGHVGTVRLSLHGTRGSFEEQFRNQAWVGKTFDECLDLNRLLSVPDAGGHRPPAEADYEGLSLVHPIHRLPKQLLGMENDSHLGSHRFLVDDFVTSCNNRTLPPNHVWAAARYLIPGLIAHDSALQGGTLLEIPDLGHPPA